MSPAWATVWTTATFHFNKRSRLMAPEIKMAMRPQVRGSLLTLAPKLTREREIKQDQHSGQESCWAREPFTGLTVCALAIGWTATTENSAMGHAHTNMCATRVHEQSRQWGSRTGSTGRLCGV